MTSPQKSAKTLDDDEILEGAIFTVKQTRHLKIIVIVMGLMLIFGFVALAIAVMNKGRTKKAGVQPQQTTTKDRTVQDIASLPGLPETVGLQKYITPDLPKGAKILSYKMSGKLMILHLKAKEAHQIVVLDMATGTVKSRIHLPQ